MSWISGIAGRAEEFLNKIDNNAAAILKKEGITLPLTDNQDAVLHEVKAELIQESRGSKSKLMLTTAQKVNNTKITRSSHSSPIISSRAEEEHLIEYLNNSSAVDIDQLQIPTTEEPTVNGHAENYVYNIRGEVKELSKENQMLKNEVRSLNSELTLLLHRTKTAERDLRICEEKCSKADKEIEQLEKEIGDLNEKLQNLEKYCQALNSENQRLVKNQNEPLQNSQQSPNQSVSKFTECHIEIQRCEEFLKAEILALQARLEKSENDLSVLQLESTAEISDISHQLTDARRELEQYRLKAQKTLCEKDKLISELRRLGSNGHDVISEATTYELEQLRNENSALTEECENLRLKLESAYDQAAETEKRIETINEVSSNELKTIRVKLAEEIARRLAAEEHCNSNAEELHSVREELSRQVGHLSERVRAREAELSRLRGQIVGSTSYNSHNTHDRITSLTSALVSKQASLEQVSKERNELRLELDQTKNKFREYTTQVQGRTISVNDTDDAKLQVPSFLIESPFDTTVTRRVKRAYSSLDAVSVRTGVFLRRYPLARIFFLCYVITSKFNYKDICKNLNDILGKAAQ